MQKPNNYENTQASGDFTPITLGGHFMVIKQVKEQKSRTGKDMIVVAFDFAKGDTQPEYFMDQFKKDIRPEKKWPHAGTNYIMVEDMNGNCSKGFKSFIAAVERSNKGFVTTWGDNFANQFTGKAVGGVFGEVENEYNGKVTMRHELRWFCGTDVVKTSNVPEPKLMANRPAPANKPASTSFMDVPVGSDDEIPFL